MIFIDAETIPVVKNIADLDPRGQDLFMKRFQKQLDQDSLLTPQGLWIDNAPLHAEFGRVLCVSVGMRVTAKDAGPDDKFRIKSIAARDEQSVLLALSEILLKEVDLVGHNIKSFDLPFLFRRFIILGLPIPPCLQISGKKPWDIPHKDTLEMWSCGDFSAKITLDRLAYALGLESPKHEICGADVGPLWYSNPNKEELPFDRDDRVLAIIKRYCAGDVLTSANCFYRMKGLPVIKFEHVTYVD